MRRPHLAVTALVLSAGLALAGCSEETSSQPSASAGASATAAAPLQDVDCSTLTISQDGSALPTIEGEAGAEPTVTWSGQAAPSDLTVTALEEGEGATVAETSFVTVNYVGWQWDSTTSFDSSYASGAPATFGLGQVIPGWTCALSGQQVGDRLLMSIPAELAYGEDESSGRPTGPLVFVVEIVSSGSTEGATMEGENALAERGISVTGELGAPATVAVDPGAAEPAQTEVIVVARGSGPAVTEADSLGLNMAYSSWDGADAQSSWDNGQAMTVGMAQAPGLSGLVGVPVGSRVVVLNPGYTDTASGQAVPAYAFVIDIDTLL